MANFNLNAAIKEVLALTGTLSQACKTFNGIYGSRISAGKGEEKITVEDVLGKLGFTRPETKGGKKGNLGPAQICDGWHPEMKSLAKDGKTWELSMFKQLTAYIEEVSVDEEGNLTTVRIPVYTHEEARKSADERKPIAQYELVPVKAGTWSPAVIMKGGKQGVDFEKNSKKRHTAREKWEKYSNEGNCYIVRETVSEEGEYSKEIIAVDSKNVKF